MKSQDSSTYLEERVERKQTKLSKTYEIPVFFIVVAILLGLYMIPTIYYIVPPRGFNNRVSAIQIKESKKGAEVTG